jgi:hypothetical protein
MTAGNLTVSLNLSRDLLGTLDIPESQKSVLVRCLSITSVPTPLVENRPLHP